VTGQASGGATPSAGASAEPSGTASAGASAGASAEPSRAASAGASAEPSGAASADPPSGASADASATPYPDASDTASAAPSETASGKPGASETASGKPGASETASGKPGASETASGKPGASETASGKPGASETASGKPGTSATASAGPAGGGTSEPSAPGSATPTPTSTSSDDAGYGSGLYFLAFLGTPSETGTWQLHFGGVHLAVNITYVDGGVTSASPFFVGAEPASFTANGTAYEPLAGMRTAALALTSSLSETQVDEARLGESSSEVLLGPDEDGQFPEAKEGIAVSELSTDQQELVLAAIKPWVEVADDDTAQQLLAAYEADLGETYIAYSGGQDLDTPGDYVRIDGPDVWIEFLCQQGVVDPEQATYQGVYRDHSRDYGGGFTF